MTRKYLPLKNTASSTWSCAHSCPTQSRVINTAGRKVLLFYYIYVCAYVCIYIYIIFFNASFVTMAQINAKWEQSSVYDH